VLTHSKALPQLRQHWDPNKANARSARPQPPRQ